MRTDQNFDAQFVTFMQDFKLNAHLESFFRSGMIGDNQLTKLLRGRGKMITIWKDFNRVPKKIIAEQYICVIKGMERFKFFSPIFRKNFYVGAYEKLAKDHCPLDLFNFDANKFLFTKQAKLIDVTLNAGDCMYIPAYYYIQSKTVYEGDNKESIIFTQEYAPHSRILDLVFEGLEDDVMTNDQHHDYDAKMLNFLHKMF
jgi:hypothetical protein